MRLPSHAEPVSTIFPFLFGEYCFIALSALPKKFECLACSRVFRKFTIPRLLLIAFLFLSILAPIALAVLFIVGGEPE